MSYPDFFHHPPESQVGGHSERSKGVKSQRSEGMEHHSQCALSGEPVAPVVSGEPPADFDAGREVRLESRDDEPYNSNEQLLPAQLDGVETKSALAKARFDAIDQETALGARQGMQELHDARVSVHLREGLAVVFLPAAKQESVSLNHEGLGLQNTIYV